MLWIEEFRISSSTLLIFSSAFLMSCKSLLEETSFNKPSCILGNIVTLELIRVISCTGQSYFVKDALNSLYGIVLVQKVSIRFTVIFSWRINWSLYISVIDFSLL